MRVGCVFLVFLAALVSTAAHSAASVVVFERGEQRIAIGVQIQIQYFNLGEEGAAERSDELFFRRLRPLVEGTVLENWSFAVQWDFGEALDADEVSLKNAFIRYTGLEERNLTITAGNQKPPFSREFLTSSARQQLVERTFVGDHNFGAPDRVLGVKLDGSFREEKLAYGAMAAVAAHDPDASKMDFDSPVDSQGDWNEGPLLAARIDLQPRGEVPYSQADFHSEPLRYSISLAGYSWWNDGDRNTYTLRGVTTSRQRVDLDAARGIELSGAVRGHGLSFDAQYQHITGETVDVDFTGGIYRQGEAALDVLAFEGGYLFLDERLEAVAAWDSFEAETYARRWHRTWLGLNHYFSQHMLKVQLSYVLSRNGFGVAGRDDETLFLMMQYTF